MAGLPAQLHVGRTMGGDEGPLLCREGVEEPSSCWFSTRFPPPHFSRNNSHSDLPGL